MMKIYQVNGKMLSPVHIGTSEVWEPLEYYIDSEQEKLYRFATEDILARLDQNEQQRFFELTDQENIQLVKNFIVEKAKAHLLHGSNGAIKVTPKVAELYQEKIDDIRNQLLIQPMIRMASNDRIYIPGSSIKGAVRTAIISEFGQKSNLTPPRPFGREVYEFEARLLDYRDVKQDPFQAIKFSDAVLEPEATVISQVYNIRENKEGNLDQTSIQLIHEVTQSKLSATKYGTSCTFEAELRIDVDLIQKRSVSRNIDLSLILNSCNRFYRDKLEMEHRKFYQDSPLAEFSEKLLNESIGANECLLRVGRFSGVESVTLDKYRNPQPPGRRGWGRSRNIADGCYPMGWTKVTVLPKE